MYKNWLQEKIQKRKELEELKKEINERFSKFTAKDWQDFRDADYKIELVENPNTAKFFEREAEKVEQLLDGTFWNLDNPDFDELTDEQIGKKGKEVLGLLKPFYRKDLVKPFDVESVYINLTREIKNGLTTNDDEYRIEPEPWCKPENDFIIDCDGNNIWYREKWERSQANIEKAKQLGTFKNYAPSLASYKSHAYISLRELYEEKIENGLTAKELHSYVKSNDVLNHLFFLYVIKRAQKQDEEAAKLLMEMYQRAVESSAEYWIKRLEEKLNIKFRPESELGIDNVKRIAKIFLGMLITGDDPEAIFDYIRHLDDDRNIELYFTRKLGKKIKDLVKIFKEHLKKKAEEYKKAECIGPLLELALKKELEIFPNDEVESFYKKIAAAKLIAKYNKPSERTTYRNFIQSDKLSERIRALTNLYYQREDYFIQIKQKGFPCLDDKKFDAFTQEEKEEFRRIRDRAEKKAHANEYYYWHTYMDFIDDDELTENEKKIYEVHKKWEKYYNSDYAMMLEGIRLELATFSDPYSWFSSYKWFNDKIYNASKNNNFTNWLLKGNPPKPSALESQLRQWIRSKEFMINGRIKDEYIEINQYQEGKEKSLYNEDEFGDEKFENESSFSNPIEPNSFSTQPQEKNNPIDRIIKKFLLIKKNKNKRERNKELLKLWIDRKSKNEPINYEEIGTIFGLKKRQVIKLCKEFERFAKNDIKRKK